MPGEPTTPQRYQRRWKFELKFAHRFVAHTFPSDDDFACSIWADWRKRIQVGHQIEEQQIREIVNVWASTESSDDLGDWIAEDVHNMQTLTDAMYAALIVSLWSRLEHFLKLVIRICRQALRPREKAYSAPSTTSDIRNALKSLVDVQLDRCASYNVVNAIRILNNSFKHTDGTYRPNPKQPQTQIDRPLLNRWDVLDAENRIEFWKLPIDELVIACNNFAQSLLTEAEAGIRARTWNASNDQ